MRLVSWIITPPLALLAAGFTIANPDRVTIGLWPLPDTVTVPLYAVVLAALGFGLLLGAGAARLASAPKRARADRLAREVARLQALLDERDAALAAAQAEREQPAPAAVQQAGSSVLAFPHHRPPGPRIATAGSPPAPLIAPN